jgi:hypothetical protein
MNFLFYFSKHSTWTKPSNHGYMIQWSNSTNLELYYYYFSFYKEYYKAFSTHIASVTLSCSKDFFFAIIEIIAFLNAFLSDLK